MDKGHNLTYTLHVACLWAPTHVFALTQHIITPITRGPKSAKVFFFFMKSIRFLFVANQHKEIVRGKLWSKRKKSILQATILTFYRSPI